MLTDSQLFNIFQPICVQLTKELNHDNILTLKRALEFVDRSLPGPFQEYLIFPLRIIIKITNISGSQDTLQQVIECIILILEKSTLTNWTILNDLFTNLTIKLTHPKDFSKVADISEELKISIFKCIDVALERSDSSIIHHIYAEEFLPKLAHLIVLLLEVAENDRAKAVRITGINILTTLTFYRKKDVSTDLRFVSAALATFIPKISTSLVKTILGDSIQGHGVTVAAMEAWMSAVGIVMNDKILEEISLKPFPKSDDDKNSNKPRLIEQNESWIKETAFKLNILIEQLSALVSHSHWKVSQCLVELAGHLLLNCFKSLSVSVGKLLDILLTLSAHEMKPVSKKSYGLLKHVIKKHSTTDTFIEILEDNLYDLVSKLPRTIRNLDDSKTLSSLNLLTRYLQLLGCRIDHLTLSQSHLKRLRLSLLHLAEMEYSDVNVVALKTSAVDFSGTFDAKSELQYQPFRKVFKYFSNENIYKEFEKICYLLGYYGDIERLIDHFLEIFTMSLRHRKEAALIVNMMILGAAGITTVIDNDDELVNFILTDEQKKFNQTHHVNNKERIPGIVELLVDEYLQPNVWSLPVSFDETESSETMERQDLIIKDVTNNKSELSVEQLNSNIYQICLLIEGFGNFSRVLGKDFDVLLMKVLYPLLDKMGSPSALVSHTAFHTATIIAMNTDKRSVAELIHDNADYLVDSLSIKLHHVFENPSAPRILRVVMQNSALDICPLIKDSVEELLNGLDNYHGQETKLFMEAINALVTGVYISLSDKSEEKVSSSPQDLETNTNEIKENATLREYFLNYHRLKVISEGDLEEDGFETESSNILEKGMEQPMDDESVKSIPYHINMTVEILERCVHIMSSEKIQLSIFVLDTINSGILVLKEWQDQLLPTVHKLWQPLIGRYLAGNLIIIKKAFNVICTMVEICGDFVSKRMLKDVLPKMVSFLETQSKISLNKNSPAYILSSAFKLQQDMLNNVGTFSIKLKLPLECYSNLISICFLYLNPKQPQGLQESAVNSLNTLATINPDAVWLHWSSFIDENTLVLPHKCFKLPKILKNEERNYLRENIQKITFFEKT